ncbi:hypothetical protein [Clostridium intestinale]|uniref:Uncharacterized protein n=1 Tax=Clostridium intestinale DSM 6191 TaxID=1121320 RepID=A0A1M6ALE3_9CLOT|nr:hypothetical protein [Clostridium intestinale]SHI37329.1 hypothetical protein SAMN02745941_03697 [Clostridium intestinale DSM 6191]
MGRCVYCGSLNSLNQIKTEDGTEFVLISKSSNGNINSSISGIVVNALVCKKCGNITLNSPDLIGTTSQK